MEAEKIGKKKHCNNITSVYVAYHSLYLYLTEHVRYDVHQEREHVGYETREARQYTGHEAREHVVHKAREARQHVRHVI